MYQNNMYSQDVSTVNFYGDRIVTVVGAPIELLLYASGRREAADVELIGLESALAELAA